MRDKLFDRPVELDDPNTTHTIIKSFKKAINALTVNDKGDAEIRQGNRMKTVTIWNYWIKF